MAKYDITHQCGHDETHDITGPTAARPARAASLAQGPCRGCWTAQTRTENAAALAAAEEAGLPELAGTPKQSAWAARIRQVHLDALPDTVAALALSMGVRGNTTAFTAMCRACLLTQTSASWWIDERALSPYSLTVYAVRVAWAATGLPREAVSAGMNAALTPTEAKSAYEADPAVVAGWLMLAALAGRGGSQ